MPTVDVPDEDWNRIVDTNLNGTFRANQIFGRQMIKQGRGSIINTGSLTSFVSFGEVTAYAASKGGVAMLTRQLGCEWAKFNVRVNAIAPGVFRTPLNSKVLDIPERSAAIAARTPMGRVGNVEELVGARVLGAHHGLAAVLCEHAQPVQIERLSGERDIGHSVRGFVVS
jgi:NAD(P)-dependent dehydrogenase (short-subunit alcohol dehydrogenase family)